MNCHLTDKCQIASRHAGVTDVAPGVASYRKGVVTPMYGLAKGSVARTSSASAVRPEVVLKNLVGMRRVPSSSSGPTAWCGGRGQHERYAGQREGVREGRTACAEGTTVLKKER